MNIRKSADISLCGRYRWELSRIWDDRKRLCCWVMLNPSTADSEYDDPTIRRCVNFSHDWGFGGILVVNLFALRATDPAELKRQPNPIGEGNTERILWAMRRSKQVVAAWGAHGAYLNRGREVLELMRLNDSGAVHLGMTKAGQPRHPLYLPKTTIPQPLRTNPT